MSVDVKEIAEEPVRCNFSFVHPGSHVGNVVLGRPLDDEFRRNNFDLCRAIDATKLAVVLQNMVSTGWLDRRDAELFFEQASVLRAQLVTANNKAFAHLLATEPTA